MFINHTDFKYSRLNFRPFLLPIQKMNPLEKRFRTVMVREISFGRFMYTHGNASTDGGGGFAILYFWFTSGLLLN